MHIRQLTKYILEDSSNFHFYKHILEKKNSIVLVMAFPCSKKCAVSHIFLQFNPYFGFKIVKRLFQNTLPHPERNHTQNNENCFTYKTLYIYFFTTDTTRRYSYLIIFTNLFLSLLLHNQMKVPSFPISK